MAGNPVRNGVAIAAAAVTLVVGVVIARNPQPSDAAGSSTQARPDQTLIPQDALPQFVSPPDIAQGQPSFSQPSSGQSGSTFSYPPQMQSTSS
ncbi:MAG: hypothetical protein R2878_03980 [Thermoleophilia bacterium]